MRMKMRYLTVSLVVLMLVLTTAGCFNISTDVDFSAGDFAARFAEISVLGKQTAGVHKTASVLKGMIYDGNERQLIEFTLPVSMMRHLLKKGISEKDVPGSGKKYLDFSMKARLAEMPAVPGLLLRLDADEDNTHILIWFE